MSIAFVLVIENHFFNDDRGWTEKNILVLLSKMIINTFRVTADVQLPKFTFEKN